MEASQPERHPFPWQQALIAVVVIGGLALTVLFAFRLYRSIHTLRHTPLRPGSTDVSLIQGWMTVPYIARAYRVPEDAIWQGLGITSRGERFRSLSQLDRTHAGGQPAGMLINKVRGIVASYQEGTPVPTLTPTPPA